MRKIIIEIETDSEKSFDYIRDDIVEELSCCSSWSSFEKVEISEDRFVRAKKEKRGKWIEYVNSHCECPFCHKEWSFFENMTEEFNYCPNCGADMREEDETD